MIKFKVWDKQDKRFHMVDDDLFWFRDNNINPLTDERYILARNTNNMDASGHEIYEYDYIEMFMTPEDINKLKEEGHTDIPPSYMGLIVFKQDMFNLITGFDIVPVSISKLRLEHNTYIRGNILETPSILDKHNIKF